MGRRSSENEQEGPSTPSECLSWSWDLWGQEQVSPSSGSVRVLDPPGTPRGRPCTGYCKDP